MTWRVNQTASVDARIGPLVAFHRQWLVLALSLVSLGTVLWSGCAARKASVDSTAQVLYYDRNIDGRVDLERHHLARIADADWELRDDDHDGWYEKKISYGYAVKETAVHLPVPMNVDMGSKP